MNFPDIVILYLAAEAAARADFPAGLAVLSRCRPGAIGVGRSRCLQKPATAVGAALRHKSLLQPLHELHIDKIQQPVKVHFLDDLSIFLLAADAVLRLHRRRVCLRVFAETDTADKSSISARTDHRCQRNFLLALFLFKYRARKNTIEEPRIPFLNQTNIVDLLLHECGQIMIFLHHELRKSILCFSDRKRLDRHIAKDAKVLQIQPVERQRSQSLLHVHVSTQDIITFFLNGCVQLIQQFLKRCDIKVQYFRQHRSIRLRHRSILYPIGGCTKFDFGVCLRPMEIK